MHHPRSFLRRRLRTNWLRGALLGATLLSAACINRFIETDVRQVGRPVPGDFAEIKSPVKVHLLDGSTVLFRTGAQVQSERIVGEGVHYALLSDVGVARANVPMDSVMGVEAFSERTLVVPTLVVSAAATAVGVVAAAGLAVAIFGSCPTVYADMGQGLALEAEGFSYAISPLMEHRDLDPLRARADADGRVRLELRNEALETHFINQVELVAVRHAPGARVMPDQGGRPVLVEGTARLAGARDRAGRDVTPVVAEPDGALYATAPQVVGAARAGDLDDWIDLDVADLPAGDSLVVMLRLRNSLLNTILLYEGMLGGRDGADWLASDLERIDRTVDLARWYVATMGMRLSVDGTPLPTDRAYAGHARLGDVGPIAFRDVAVVLPRPAADARTARVRLRFVADNWRIDAIRVAGAFARPAVRTLAVDSVVVPTPAAGGGPVVDAAAIPALAAADDRYLETRPGQRMTLVFAPDAGPDATAAQGAGDASATTYLIAWQGWYREWIRAGWLTNPTRTEPFVPGDDAILTALRRWTERQVPFERAFYSSTIPVR